MARRTHQAHIEKAVITLTAVVVSAAIIAALYWGRELLIPLALAVYLAFLINPLVRTFQRWGLRRVPSVLAVTFLAAVVLVTVGWGVGEECSRFVSRLPDYAEAVDEKIQNWKTETEDNGFGRLNKVLQEITGNAPQPSEPGHGTPIDVEHGKGSAPVVVHTAESRWTTWVIAQIPPALELLVQAAFVVVLAFFMLLGREELRNRVMRLVGHGHVSITTRAVDEASQRISRYLLMQFFVNAGYGAAATIGLYLIGVELAPLWGFLCFVLRYVPYIGAPIAFVFPLLLSLLSSGWLPVVLVIALYVSLELIVAQGVEPWLFGHSIGVAPVALLATTVFWALIWGPVGLVLACPLTVCMVILGKYVPRLKFLSVLLAEEPALTEDFVYYQRLAAHDQEEALAIVRKYETGHALEAVMDNILLPALSYTRRDRIRDGLSEEEQQKIYTGVAETLEMLKKECKPKGTTEKPPARLPGEPRAVRLLAIPSHDQADELAIHMLEMLLDSEKWQVHAETEQTLAAEVKSLVADEQPAMVYIGAVLPGSLAHTRYLCKRLHTEFPDLPIVVGLLGPRTGSVRVMDRLKAAGASHVDRTMTGTLAYLQSWRPPLLARQLAESPAAV
jgi:predicted PurR-regulated permease PerM